MCEHRQAPVAEAVAGRLSPEMAEATDAIARLIADYYDGRLDGFTRLVAEEVVRLVLSRFRSTPSP